MSFPHHALTTWQEVPHLMLRRLIRDMCIGDTVELPRQYGIGNVKRTGQTTYIIHHKVGIVPIKTRIGGEKGKFCHGSLIDSINAVTRYLEAISEKRHAS